MAENTRTTLNSAPEPKERPARRGAGRWLKRIALGLMLLVIVLALTAYFGIPAYIRSAGPALVSKQSAKTMQGPVAVKSLDVGWSGPIRLTGVTIQDPQAGASGKPVVAVDITWSHGLWSFLRAGMDLGTTTISGSVDIVRSTAADGTVTSNLDRALAPPTGAAAAPSTSSTPTAQPATLPEGLKATLDLAGLDVSLTELDAQGATIARAMMKSLKGQMTIDRTAGPAQVAAKLNATFTDGTQRAPGTFDATINATNLSDASGLMTPDAAQVNADIAVTGLPSALLDAVARQKGVLAELLGTSADLTIKATSAGPKAAADLTLRAPNLQADLGLVREGDRLGSTRPGAVKVQSTAFAQRLPAVANALTDAGLTIDPAGWPSVEVAINALDIPAGGPGGAGWAGARIDLAVQIGSLTGQLRREAGGGVSQPQFVAVQPTSLTLRSTDLGASTTLQVATKATIDNQSAGNLNIRATLGSLVVPAPSAAAGQLVFASGQSGVPSSIDAEVDAGGVATSLLQPFVAAVGLPIVLREDVGPTLDLSLKARSVGEVKPGRMPPTDIDLAISSENITALTKMSITPEAISLRAGEPARLGVVRAGPLLQRVLAAQPTPPPMRIDGAVRLDVSISQLNMPLAGGKVQADTLSTQAGVQISQTRATLNPGTPGALDVALDQFQAEADIRPGASAVIRAGGPLQIDGSPAALRAEATILGLGSAPASTMLPALGGRRIEGSIDLTGLPGSAIEKLAFDASTGAELRALAGELIGPGLTINTRLTRTAQDAAQAFTLAISGPQLTIRTAGALQATDLNLEASTLTARVSPEAARAALRVAGQTDGAVARVTLRQASDLTLTVAPVAIPLKAGALTPDFARAGERQLSAVLALSSPLIADGVDVGGRSESFGLAGLRADVAAPLAMLGAGSGGGGGSMQLRANADLIGRSETDRLARLTAEVSRQGTGPIAASLNLADLLTERVDGLMGKPGLISGAVGERMNLAASATRAGDSSPWMVDASVTAPRMTVERLRAEVQSDRLALREPMRLTWTATPAWLASMLTSPDKPAAMTFDTPLELTADVRTLAMALPSRDSSGMPIRGVLQPGVFALDAEVRSTSISFTPAAQVGQPAASPVVLSGVNIVAKTAPGGGGQGHAPLEFAATVSSIRSGQVQTPEATRINGSVVNFADSRGTPTPDVAALTLNARTGMIPTSLIEALTNQPGSLTPLLGENLTASVDLVNVARKSGSGTAKVDLRAPNASFVLGGPVRDGVLRTSEPGATPMLAELNEFSFTKGRAVGTVSALNPLGYLGFVAGVQRLRDDVNTRPSMISSPDLALPLDGDLRKLNGTIRVDLGRINMKMEQNFLQLLDIPALNRVVDRVANAQQRPVPPFAISINQGVATYKDVQLPIGSYTFRATGTIDLPNQQMDVVTYVPTAGLAPGALASLNKSLGDGFGRILPKDLTESLMVPIRLRGPTSDPSTSIDVALMVREAGDRLLRPDRILDTLGNLLGGGKKDEPAKPEPAPEGESAPEGQPKPADTPKEEPKERPRRPLPFPLPIPLPGPR